jgi:hypothetical protein
MFDSIRRSVLRLFRVPHDPEPPVGAPGSVKVFRAARNFYKLRLFRWGIGQLAAIAGILFSLTFLEEMQRSMEEVRVGLTQPAAPVPKPQPEANPAGTGEKTVRSKTPGKSRPRSRSLVLRIAEDWPWWLFPLLTVVEWAGVILYVIQIPITYAMARLDYELRWYIVTDRSLRIRAGLASVLESTMSFANVQQVVVSQGPVQRLLGIADLRVQSAGGGGDQHERGGRDSLHTGVFHGVDNANQIRDLILERLRAFREAGLGDPEDAPAGHAVSGSSSRPTLNAVLDAGRELLQETRTLREKIR